ncbi:MAG: hypothetical protein IKK15_05875, partial [Akkermansia sp.]|nr:hypothetical protein [Akkermansia sp.]
KGSVAHTAQSCLTLILAKNVPTFRSLQNVDNTVLFLFLEWIKWDKMTQVRQIDAPAQMTKCRSVV